jgi:hypothetical protein
MNKLFLILSVLTICFFTINVNGVINRLTFVEPNINKDSLIRLGMPERITNQYITIRKFENYQNKSFFIVDTRENLIFFFDRNGNFVAKSPTIDGFDKQNENKTEGALKTWYDHANDIGFKWDSNKKQYIDLTGKNRSYSNNLVYNHLAKTQCRFFPKGVYQITKKYHYNGFVGKGENTFNVNTLDGKNLALAIHSLYKSEYRIQNMNKLVSLIGNNFDKINVPNSFRSVVLNNINNGTFNNSFGCINVPEKFIELTKNESVNSLVFVMSENTNDYLVK